MATKEYNPPIFFAIAFVILIIGLYSKFAFKGQESRTPKPIVKDNSNLQSEQIVKTLKKLDFNAPVVCTFDDNTSTVSAQMDGTDIAVIIAPRSGMTQHMLVSGDCLYRWSEERNSSGLKKCGMGSYISMGKQFLGSGLLSSEMIEEGMKEMGKSMQFDLVKALESCKNAQVVDRKIFDLPRGVRFQDEANSPSK